jgi:F-type H+-transporting ATPase subunit delta
MSTRVSKRYAKALFALAEERGLLDAVRADFQRITAVVGSTPELLNAFHNPRVSAEQRKQLIETAFRSASSALTKSFLDFLLSKRRESIIGDVAQAVQELFDEREGILRAEVYSAAELTEAERGSIAQKVNALTGKRIDAVWKTDASLIGGFVVRYGDVILDGSLKNQLSKLRHALEHGASKN